MREAYEQTAKKSESQPQKDSSNAASNQPCLWTPARGGMYYLQLEMGNV